MFWRSKKPVETVRQLQIVDSKGNILLYQGKRMVFDDTPEENERANTICWLVNREAVGGPFVVRVVERAS